MTFKIVCDICDDDITIDLPITESVNCKCCGDEALKFIPAEEKNTSNPLSTVDVLCIYCGSIAQTNYPILESVNCSVCYEALCVTCKINGDHVSG